MKQFIRDARESHKLTELARALVPLTVPRVMSGRGVPNNVTGTRNRLNTGGAFPCQCGTSFASKDSLSKHLKGGHCRLLKAQSARDTATATGQRSVASFFNKVAGSNDGGEEDVDENGDPATAGAAAQQGPPAPAAAVNEPPQGRADPDQGAADELVDEVEEDDWDEDGEDQEMTPDVWVRQLLTDIDKMYCGVHPRTGNVNRGKMCNEAKTKPSACDCHPVHPNTTMKNFYVDPPNPLMCGVDTRNPQVFWRKRIYIWLPEFLFHPHVKHMPCPNCKQVGQVIKKGWNAPVSLFFARCYPSVFHGLSSDLWLPSPTATSSSASAITVKGKDVSSSSWDTTKRCCNYCRRLFV